MEFGGAVSPTQGFRRAARSVVLQRSETWGNPRNYLDGTRGRAPPMKRVPASKARQQRGVGEAIRVRGREEIQPALRCPQLGGADERWRGYRCGLSFRCISEYNATI